MTWVDVIDIVTWIEDGRGTVLFMLVERFTDQDARAVYAHLRDRGRGLPEGLKYVGSWVEPNFDRCFQLMECDDLRLIQEWALHWHGLGTFEVVPVVTGKETAEVVNRHLPPPA